MMRIFLCCLMAATFIGCGFESPQQKAQRYRPRHLKNGFYQFSLDNWPLSLAEFEARYADSLQVVSWGPTYNTDGIRVVGMLVLTHSKKETR